MNKQEGVFLGHTNCPIHGGSDSLALYEKTVGDEVTIDAYCWSECGYVSPSRLKELGVTDGGKEILVEFVQKSKGEFTMTDDILAKIEEVKRLPIKGWRERGIVTKAFEVYGVPSEFDDEGVLVRQYYPSTEKGEIVGYHVRNDKVKQAKNRGEDVKGRTPFYALGKVKSSCELFGQHLYAKGGKYVVLTAGEIDAVAMYMALNLERVGGKWQTKKFITPVVSTMTGESSLSQIRNNFEWLSSFENVLICYDNDKAGKEGAIKVAHLFKPDQAKTIKLTKKDVCEYTKEGEYNELVRAFWNAETFIRSDVLGLGQMWDDFENDDTNVKIPFPTSWVKVNDMMNGGMEAGEITLIGALTSIGKSTLINNIVYHLIENTNFKVGAMFLEGTKRETVRDLLSMDIGVNLRHAPRGTMNLNELKQRFFNNLARKDQLAFVDHQGSISPEQIMDKFRYLAKVEQCDLIIIDPLQCAVNSSDNGAIIQFMDALLKFAKETNVAVLAVSHMRKPSSDDPHGVSEYDLLGSSSLNQIAFTTILMSRDKMSDSAKVRNSTKLQMVKCRRTGNTGDAGWLRFDINTMQMYPTSDPYIDEDGDMLFGESQKGDDTVKVVTDDFNEVASDGANVEEWDMEE